MEATLQDNVQRLQRLTDFNALLAQVNSSLATVRDEEQLLQKICDLAIRYAHFDLALIARPDASGWFQFQSASGNVSFLEGQRVSIDPAYPEGRGSFAKVWEQERPIFIDNSLGHPNLAFWQDRYQSFGFKSSAALPILRNGRMWGIFALFHPEINAFDDDLKNLLTELALDISRGLDFIAQQTLQHALLHNSVVSVFLTKDKTFQQLNKRTFDMLGRAPEEMEGQSIRILFADDHEWERVCESLAAFQTQKEVKVSLVRMVHKNGSILFGDFSGVLLDAKEDLVVWTVEDVTERHENEQTIRKLSAARATLLANTTAGIGVVRYPERIFIESNQGFLNVLGFEHREEVIGHATRQVFPTGEEYQVMTELSQEILAKGQGSLRDLLVVGKEGKKGYIDVAGQRLEGEDPEHPIIVWTAVDVTERHRLAEELARQAHIDSLTGLPNRRALELEFEKAMARATRHDCLLAVVMMDLDHFKQVNDTYGHDAGDHTLRVIGERLQETLRCTDFVARLGGDEFIFLIEDCRDLKAISAVLDKVGEAVREPITLRKGGRVGLDLSAGICLYPHIATEEPKALLQYADIALYQNKAYKNDRLRFWTLYGEETPRKRNNAQSLLQNGGLQVTYQPILDNRTRKIVGLEALARLQQEDGQLLFPGEFLPQLETDDLFDLSFKVLDQVLQDLGALDREGISLWASINIDPRNISKTFVNCLQRKLAPVDIDPGRIYLEILESGTFAEQQLALDHLHALKAQGVRLALDDMGTAYSSLLRLKDLPIDKVKLDQGFIRTLEERPQDLQFVEAILDLANGLGRELVVEGVETDDILDAVSVLGVPAMQGYGIARPMPFVQLQQFLSRRSFPPCQHPHSLLGVYAKLLSNHSSRKKSIMLNLHMVDHLVMAEHTTCPIHSDLLRLGVPESDRIHQLHRDYHRAVGAMIDRLANTPASKDWSAAEAAIEALLEAVIAEYRRRKMPS